MYQNLSKLIFTNVGIIAMIIILHEQIEAFNNLYIYSFLIALAFVNGIYMQKSIRNEKVLAIKFQEEQDLSNLILSSVPTGTVLIRENGTILYVNEAIGAILGSVDTVGLNILEFDTIKSSALYDAIISAIAGVTVELKNQVYTSYTSRKVKNINVLCRPINPKKIMAKNDVILFITDVSYEKYLLKKTEEQYIGMFSSFAKLIDAKDTYTGHHSHNVTKYTQLVIDNYQADEKFAIQLKIAATLHDIGKIAIPDDILKKPGELTQEEYNKMKEHPVMSSELLKDIEDYKEIRLMIKHHHERWDGKGYPDGLVGNDIPIGAQIIAIADTYDAIVSNRVYRKGRSKEDALRILVSEKGKQFNSEFVDIFIQAITKED